MLEYARWKYILVSVVLMVAYVSLPTVPADPMQREYALRAGVNIMMYMLTGNYKSDQVHAKDLIERLGN